MINIEIIDNESLNNHISKFDSSISFLKSSFNIELRTYGNILRIALNALQDETLDNLIERIQINKELERALGNAGGYEIDFINDQNPKSELIDLINVIKVHSPKRNALLKHLKNASRKEILIADINDAGYIDHCFRNPKFNILSYTALKKSDISNKSLIFYSFNGYKDFDFLYNLESDITIFLYDQENNLYQNQINKRKTTIEEEIKSGDRFQISGIKYSELPDAPVNISETIEGIVGRLDNLSNTAYDVYRNESDLLLNEIEEKIIYKVTTDSSILYLDSNDTIFNEQGDLIKAYKVKVGDKIRVYPREQFAENLYQVAVDTEQEVFGKVEEDSLMWNDIVNQLRKVHKNDDLYEILKAKGLKILPSTLEMYGRGLRKFPMFNRDLRAIFRLYYPAKSDSEIDEIITPLLKSKTTYNSTMILLGRGLKQELRLFLKEKQIGDILAKRNFNANTLDTFIQEHMKLHRIKEKEAFSDNPELIEAHNLFQPIEI
jgi:hypothetical protein